LVDANILEKHTVSILRAEVVTLRNGGLICSWRKGTLREWASQGLGGREMMLGQKGVSKQTSEGEELVGV
jgi:hypothetical protein